MKTGRTSPASVKYSTSTVEAAPRLEQLVDGPPVVGCARLELISAADFGAKYSRVPAHCWLTKFSWVAASPHQVHHLLLALSSWIAPLQVPSQVEIKGIITRSSLGLVYCHGLGQLSRVRGAPWTSGGSKADLVLSSPPPIVDHHTRSILTAQQRFLVSCPHGHCIAS